MVIPVNASGISVVALHVAVHCCIGAGDAVLEASDVEEMALDDDWAPVSVLDDEGEEALSVLLLTELVLDPSTELLLTPVLESEAEEELGVMASLLLAAAVPPVESPVDDDDESVDDD
jgi:hypothetical protein